MEKSEFAARNLTHGQTNALVKILGGEAKVRGILDGYLKATVSSRAFPTWTSVTIGVLKSAEEYEQALKGRNIGCTHSTRWILDRMPFVEEPEKLELVLVARDDLGYDLDGSRYEDICRRAQELGLRLCPAEVGPALRLALPTIAEQAPQMMHPYLIAMEPVKTGSERDGREESDIFALCTDREGPCLLARPAGSPPFSAKYVFAR